MCVRDVRLDFGGKKMSVPFSWCIFTLTRTPHTHTRLISRDRIGFKHVNLLFRTRKHTHAQTHPPPLPHTPPHTHMHTQTHTIFSCSKRHDSFSVIFEWPSQAQTSYETCHMRHDSCIRVTRDMTHSYERYLLL